MVVVAEGARANAALTAGFSVSSSSVIVSFKRPGCWAGTVFSPAAAAGVRIGGPVPFVVANTSSAAITVNSAAPSGVPIWRPVPFIAACTIPAPVAVISAAVAVNSAAPSGVPIWRPVPFIAAGTIPAPVAVISAAVAVNSAARVSTSIVVVAVIKRVAPGAVPLVIMNYDPVMPIGAPMMPAPAITSEVADSEADTKRQVRAAIPDSGIRIPPRPRHDWTAVNHPRIIRGDVNDFWASRLNDDRRVLRRYGLLGRAGKIARFLRPLAHHLYGVHHILLLIVVGVA